MSFLLDTCVLSELVKPRPSPSVSAWIASQQEHELFLSVITIGELHKGVAKLEPSKRRSDLERWLVVDLANRFRDRILAVDSGVARIWGVMLGESERSGRPLPAIDALIAATAKANDCIVVTRNESDIAPTGVHVVNPWV